MENKPTTGGGQEPNGGAPEKTFTQGEMDAIIGERLAREREKYADYDILKAKAAKFDESVELGMRMGCDPRQKRSPKSEVKWRRKPEFRRNCCMGMTRRRARRRQMRLKNLQARHTRTYWTVESRTSRRQGKRVTSSPHGSMKR